MSSESQKVRRETEKILRYKAENLPNLSKDAKHRFIQIGLTLKKNTPKTF